VMLVGPGLEAVGSVSGGCVEGAVYQLGEEILESGEPVLQRYGVSDEAGVAVWGAGVGGAFSQWGEEIRGSGEPVLQRYGVSDESAFAVGLTCGGIIDVFVERVDGASYPELGAIAADVADGRPVAGATVIAHPPPARLGKGWGVRPQDAAEPRSGTLGSDRADDAV